MDDTTMDLIPAAPVLGEGYHFTAPRVPTKECAVCKDEVEASTMMEAPCGDSYCGGCVNELFDRAAKYEINFPPKCCDKVITLEKAELFLSSDIYNKFQKSFEEFSTTNRTYCSDPECATFIPPKAIDDHKAKCPTCQKMTCTTCKAKAHHGNCLEDPALHSLLKTAAEAGLQRCRQCKRMIELIMGCYHITCVCGAEFCYLCGAKWKTCACRQADVQNLVNQAWVFDENDEHGIMNFALANVRDIDQDGRIEWLPHAAAEWEALHNGHGP